MIFDSLASYGSSTPASSESLMDRVFGIGQGKTSAGTIVNHSNAINIPAVYAAVGIIADGISMLPVDVLQKKESGTGSDPVGSHPISYILNTEANPFMTAMTARNTLAYHQVLWGNGYQEIERNNKGEARGLWPLLPDRTAPKKAKNGDLYYQTNIEGVSYEMDREDVLHVPALSFDGYIGTSPVTVARQAMGLAIAAEEFGSKFFGNDAKSGGFLLHPGRLGEKAKTNIVDAHQRQGGIENAHRVKVLEEGMKFVQTTIPPEDAQFLGTREFQITEIARIFRVPLVLLQAMEKSTSWGSGIEQMMLGFLIFTLNPWIVRTEQEMNRKLFTETEREKGLYVKLNVNALMRSDMAGRSAFYTAGINTGYLTRNEVRDWEDLNPLPGLDKPLTPLNMSDGSQPENKEEDEE